MRPDNRIERYVFSDYDIIKEKPFLVDSSIDSLIGPPLIKSIKSERFGIENIINKYYSL